MNREIYARMREVEDHHWWFRGRRAVVSQALADLHLPAGCSILDAGCGTGGNLATLSAFGNTTGVEYDPEAVAIAAARGGATVLQGHLPDGLPSFDKQFHVVVMTDVLEHIERDEDSVAAVRDVMAPGAYLVLTVPAFSALWSKHDEIHHHKRRYVKSGLRRVIERGGLRLVRATYFNTTLFPIIAAVRIQQRLFPPADVMEELTVPARLINTALESVMRWEGALVRYVALPFGVSLLAVARRTE